MSHATSFHALVGGLLALCLGLAGAPRADAALVVHLERLNDTEAVTVVSGELDPALPGANAHSLALMDPFGVRPGDFDVSWVLDSSDLHAGGYLFNFANTAGRCAAACPGTPTSPGAGFDNSGRANTLYFGNNDLVFPLPFPFQPIPTQVPFGGAMRLALQNGTTFAAVGAGGEVYWGTTEIGLGKGVLVGTWDMGAPAVPEPGTPALLCAGLLALWGRRRARR